MWPILVPLSTLGCIRWFGLDEFAAILLVRAFAVVPDLLLMDEPLVSLDAPTARKIRELLLQLWQERPA